MYVSQMPSDILPKVTASYSIVPPSVTNEFNSSTENIAIERLQYEMARDKFMNWVHRAVNRLPKRKDRSFICIIWKKRRDTIQTLWMK